jgi:serine/threonine protein kinase
MVLEYLEKTFKAKAISAVQDRRSSKMELMAGFGYFATKMLQKIHSRGYVHCDIHARAFMEDSSKRFRIIDFGKARAATVKDGELRSSIVDGKWVGADNPILLSVNELRDELCRPRDDLLRLGEILIEHWPTKHMSAPKRERITMGLSRLSEEDQLKEIIDFKTTLSLASLFPTEILKFPDEFPPLAELGTFMDAFYHKALSLGPDQAINYDEFLSVFIGDEEGLLSIPAAKAISDLYWPEN